MTGQSNNISVTEVATPAQRISMPDFIDWHMIFDYELDQLSQVETGVIGSIGFVALGAALGSVGQFCDAISKFRDASLGAIHTSDGVYIGVFVGSVVAALICLGLFAIDRYRNAGLVKKIRGREKHDLLKANGQGAGSPSNVFG